MVPSWGSTQRVELNRRSFLFGLTAAGVGLGLASGCSFDDDGGDGGGGGGGGGNGRLRSAIAEWGSGSFDPVLIAASSAWEILTPMFDSVLGLDPNGDYAPGVAESWDFAEDNRMVTMHIRKDLKFHNGDQCTANDVRFSLVRWYDPALNALALPVYDYYVDDAENDIQVVDDYTLTIKTSGPADVAIQTLSLQQTGDAYVLPQKYVTDDYDNFLKNPIGTGPFKFKSTQAGESILFEASGTPHPYRKTSGFKELEIILVAEEATRIAMLQTEAADIIAITPESVDAVKGVDGAEVGESPNTIMAHLFYQGSWNPDSGPMNDVRVRQALSLAVNREEMVDELLSGYGTPIPGTVTAEFFPGMAGVDIDEFPGDVFDLDKAKSLMEEAGVGEGDLDIPIWTFDMSGAPWLHSLGEIFLGYWDALGVTGKIQATDLATFIGMCELDQLDERTLGTCSAFRRRINFEIGQAVQGYDPRETPGGAMMGPPEQSNIPNIVDRVEEAIAAEGDDRNSLSLTLLHEASELYLQPGLFYASALWGIAGSVGSYELVKRSQTLGMVYETMQPA